MFNSISSEQQKEQKVVQQEIISNKENGSNIIEPQKNLKESISISYFGGELLDLMGWNFLRILLTIVTLGIGTTWVNAFI